VGRFPGLKNAATKRTQEAIENKGASIFEGVDFFETTKPAAIVER
jgi:hypothetical protein